MPPTLRLLDRPESPPRRGGRIFAAWRVLRGGLEWAVGAARLPGFIRPHRIEDRVTGDTVVIRVSRRFTTVSVNGRDYYFRRLTGEYDGAGSAPTTPLGCTPGGTLESATTRPRPTAR